jgi:hypothetical protein
MFLPSRAESDKAVNIFSRSIHFSRRPQARSQLNRLMERETTGRQHKENINCYSDPSEGIVPEIRIPAMQKNTSRKSYYVLHYVHTRITTE